MKKIIGLFMLGLIMVKVSFGQRGFASFKSSTGNSIRISIAGKEINDYPKSSVHIKGKAGTKEIKIDVYDRNGKYVGEYVDKVYIKPGFRTEFNFTYDDKCGMMLKKAKISPYSTRHLKNPDYYYNQKFIANYTIPSLRLNSSILESSSLPSMHFNTLALC